MKVHIRPVDIHEVSALESHLPFGDVAQHQRRLKQHQAGETHYVIAWDGTIPVGHVLLHWQAPPDDPAAAALRACVMFEDLLVSPLHRRRGVGAALLDAAERIARQRGCTCVGLGVGVENEAAIRLYESRGYRDLGFGAYRVHGRYVNDAGDERRWEETCISLVKQL